MAAESIFCNIYIEIIRHSEDNLLQLTWDAKSEDLSPEAYKEQIIRWVSLVKDEKPKGIFVDVRKHFFIIFPEIQTWFVEVVFPYYAASGMKKLAFIASEDYISQLSIEQTMEEAPGVPFLTRYFSSVDDARIWAAQ